MRLTVLGGSAASPNTGMGCAGFLVQTGRTRLVLDLGPGTLQELRRHTDFRTLDAVIISHMHVDHVLDLLALRHALAYNPVAAPEPIPVWLPPGGINMLTRASAPFDACDRPGRFSDTVDVAEYDPTFPLPIGDTVVTFAPAVHYVPAWSIRVHTSAAADLGYTGDTGPTAPLAGFFAEVGVLVAEATLLEPGDKPVSERGSLTAAEAGALAATANAETLVLTHMWEEHGFAAYKKQAAKVFSGRIELAAPGLTVAMGPQDHPRAR
ncbi:MAG: MBL fold metallo-hydrolase [Chloroflexota bacterium]|nr:MBL fold metallo-hydrolase [Chloroflexia bacterium]MDQ3226185.1 MBL fold metallo-hydrolase [Chloroflexota bacterium]